MSPSFTIRFQLGDEDEVQEARDWVEYLNGPADSTWGKIRADRGHPAPYNVTYFYLGNEISQQARCPQYPQDIKCIRPPSTKEYQKMLLNVVSPMLEASPIPIRLLTVSGSTAWNTAWANAVGDHIFATSFHDGYMNQPQEFTQEAVTTCAMRPRGDFMNSVASLRKTLNATGKTIAISADEWGLGPPWRAGANGPNKIRFSVAHGMYAAGFLGAITRGSQQFNLQFSNYFEPVNEGAITVQPFSAKLTPVGEVMKLFAAHVGGVQVQLPAAAFTGDLDTVATVHGNRSLVVTVSHLNAVGWVPYDLALSLPSWTGKPNATTTTLKAESFAADSLFSILTSAVTLSAKRVLHLQIPPFSVVQVRLGTNA